ncbi:MAG: FAD-dependent oxidoreductase, partial [Gammaproteobacteria bacterium]
MQPDSDCLIVGAGLVGSATALALARLGFDVRVLERRAQLAASGREDVRALVLSAASVSILESLEVWARLEPAACAVKHIRVSDRGGFGVTRLDAGELGLAALGYSVRADHLLEVLNGAVLEHPRVTVEWSTPFAGMSSSGDGVALSAATGARFTARLLVAADGVDSGVREALGIGVERLDYGQTAVVANLRAGRPAPHTAFEHFTRSGPLAFLPAGGNRYVSVQCLVSEAASAACALDEDEYLAMLQRRFGRRLGELGELGRRRVHALARQRARALVAPRAVVVGNAANTVHPNGAQGFNLGLRDAAELARTL